MLFQGEWGHSVVGGGGEKRARGTSVGLHGAFRLGGDGGHHLHALEGVGPEGGLPGQHDRVRPLPHCYRNVRNLCAPSSFWHTRLQNIQG